MGSNPDWVVGLLHISLDLTTVERFRVGYLDIKETIMIEFTVKDMSCGHCVGAVTKTLQSVDPQAKVEVDLASKKVKVESTQDRAKLADALTEAGYPPA